MDFIAMARRIRQIIMEQAENFTDEEAVEVPFAFPKWKTETAYTVGERIRFNEDLYRVLIDHTSQENWSPAEAPSLYARILPGQEGTEIGEWVQPDSTNPYMIGDKVRHNGKVWVSIIDYNVWEPGVYGWEESSE